MYTILVLYGSKKACVHMGSPCAHAGVASRRLRSLVRGVVRHLVRGPCAEFARALIGCVCKKVVRRDCAHTILAVAAVRSHKDLCTSRCTSINNFWTTCFWAAQHFIEVHAFWYVFSSPFNPVHIMKKDHEVIQLCKPSNITKHRRNFPSITQAMMKKSKAASSLCEYAWASGGHCEPRTTS